MNFFEFEQALIRLKDCVGLRTDKDVARLLEMDVSALNKRKTRGSFPVQKLEDLAIRRPDLKIDTTHVLTGKSQREAAIESAAKVVRVARMAPTESREEPAGELQMTHDELMLVDAYRGASPAARHAILASAVAFAEEAKKAKPTNRR